MPIINGKYYSEAEVAAIKRELNVASSTSNDKLESLLISGAVGAITGSTIIGGLVGGSFLGGFLGDAVEGTDDSWF